MSNNIMATITEYLAKKNRIAKEEKELETLKNDILDYMGNNDELIIGQYKATNKTCTRHGIDEKKLKELFPDVAVAVAKETEYKRFTVV